ncbi:hypothetical protein [Azospirillum halopraeferens]|uniref:hypothetical protein n=1 Tax=Azospirillum halopraeferens TaxID=34010 RepID=UPI00040A1AF3|nr:hypothetical protein [Azospirillum halopraeferens]
MRKVIAIAVAVSALAVGPALACEWKNQSVTLPQTGTDTAELPQTPMPAPARPAG